MEGAQAKPKRGSQSPMPQIVVVERFVAPAQPIVERRRGAGAFVASPKIHFNKLMSYTEHMASRGLAPRSRVLVAKS
jgi:hypothetical protein